MITSKELEALLKPIETEEAPPNSNKVQQFELSISHRELRKIPLHLPFKNHQVSSLDISYNYFKDLKPFKDQPNPHLTYLNISFNFLISIDAFASVFQSLKVLNANANRIQSVNINNEDFPSLNALYLKNNKIKFFLNCPMNVEILCLDHNQLEELAFTGGENLEILSASHNGIQETQLKLAKLTFLDLEQNQISEIPKLQKLLQQCPNLLSLNMIGNYVSKIAHKRFMILVLTLCPRIVKIDEIIINPHVREAFRILKEEDDMEGLMKQTEEKYLNRMNEQLRLKEELIEKLKAEEREIDEKFRNYLKEEKEQLNALENYAKNNLGKKKFAITTENSGFKKMINNADSDSQSQQEGGITDYLANGILDMHKDKYEHFKKNQSSKSNSEGRRTEMQKYLGVDDESELLEGLGGEEQERRKRNMRNPSLIYRNSNELIGETPAPMGEVERSSGDELVINPKCMPYLAKNYGFHTII